MYVFYILYTIKEIQGILQISAPTAYKLVKSGAFRSVKFDNTIRISKESFDKWLEGNRDDDSTSVKRRG